MAEKGVEEQVLAMERLLHFSYLSTLHLHRKLFFHKKRGYPYWISSKSEHETGFEPATLALARRYSTTEPLVHF